MIRRLVIAANWLYAIALVVLGVVPEIPVVARGIPDHAAHALAAAIQAGLLFTLLLPRVGRGKAALLAAIGAAAYGGLVEGLQLLQPARTVELRDLAANAFGGSVAASLAWVTSRHSGLPEGR